ncbi:MAG: DUF177 domain-containing protein [Candidatus Margulisiibacteriota bacterium]
MRLDLSGLLKEKGAGLGYKEKVAVDFPRDELEVVGPVEVDLAFTNTGGSIWAQGRLKANIKVPCSRCLKEYEEAVTANVEERLKKKPGPEDEDVVFEIDETGSVDLSEIIRQSLLLNIPIKTLCSADCKGLLKDADEKKVPDPRLAKLKEIKFKGEK